MGNGLQHQQEPAHVSAALINIHVVAQTGPYCEDQVRFASVSDDAWPDKDQVTTGLGLALVNDICPILNHVKMYLQWWNIDPASTELPNEESYLQRLFWWHIYTASFFRI